MRISVWWSFYIDAADEKEVRTAISTMETALGHPIQIEDIENSDERVQRQKKQDSDTIFLVEAWSFIHAQTSGQATLSTLKQIHKLGSSPSCFGFQHFTPNDEWEGFATIGWSGNTTKHALSQFLSCSVQLSHYTVQQAEDVGCAHLKAEEREACLEFLGRIQAWPSRTLPSPDNTKSNYIALYYTALKTSTKQKLMQKHWPKIQQKFSSKVTMTDLQKRPHNKGAFRFMVRQELANKTEEEAVITCLTITGGTIQIHYNERGQITWLGTAGNGKNPTHKREGLHDFSLERKD